MEAKRSSDVGFFSSLKFKFALSYFAIIGVVLGIMNTFFLTASRDMIFSSKQVFVHSQVAIIETALSDIDSLTVDTVTQVVSRLDVKGLTHIAVMGAQGNVLYDSQSLTDENGDTTMVVSEFIDEYRDRVYGGYDVFYSGFKNGAFSAGAYVPVMKGGVVMGAVYVRETDAEQGAILIGLQTTLKNISLMIITISIALIAFMLWTVMRRITSILGAIQSVREGEYNYNLELSGRDEMTMLGREFNSLTQRLRETDDIRRRFVADASHELKTPLASIRLLSDSILQNETIDIYTIREFVADIGDEAERLARTTEKLMTLSRLDGDVDDAAVPVNMRDVVAATLRRLGPLAATGNLSLNSSLEAGCIVAATEDSLHQIVFNLVENALKYNKPNGSVSTRLFRDGAQAVLTVEDTGIGVPEDDLPYIFDRFYRVDKARSRAFGGSGLGLSIVSDMVREYSGTIAAYPRDSGGMVFEVRFPIYTAGNTGQ